MSETITKSIIVKADVNDAYQAWENFENFPRFMNYVESVSDTGANTSRWVVSGPLGKKVEWEAETTLREVNKRIGWNTKDRETGNLTTSGQVTFTSLANNETQITVMMNIEPQAGVVGDLVAKLFAHPDEKVDEDLKNFKEYIEGRK